MKNPPLRIQVVSVNVLEAEVIVEFEDAALVWSRFTNAKYRAGKPCGGAIIRRADLPRYWDAPVGSSVLV